MAPCIGKRRIVRFTAYAIHVCIGIWFHTHKKCEPVSDKIMRAL